MRLAFCSVATPKRRGHDIASLRAWCEAHSLAVESVSDEGAYWIAHLKGAPKGARGPQIWAPDDRRIVLRLTVLDGDGCFWCGR